MPCGGKGWGMTPLAAVSGGGVPSDPPGCAAAVSLPIDCFGPLTLSKPR